MDFEQTGFHLSRPEKRSEVTTVQLYTALSTPVMLANQTQMTYLKIGLIGTSDPLPKMAPINLALIIDKSNSMRGVKIQQAKAAARKVVEQLRDEDTIALISYDHHVEVLLPATKASEKAAIYAAIDQLTAGGNTAMFSGLERGAKEIRKFSSPERINRIFLVSDGHANVGPSSLDELGILATELGKEGIAVTTIGLGLDYHEDLMTRLAKNSNGNHLFAEHPTDLVTLFDQEFGDLLLVVAQQITVTIHSTQNSRPLRVLGKEATIQGTQVVVKLNQLYRNQEKQVLLQLEVPPIAASEPRTLANITVTYHNVGTGTTDQLSSAVSATFTTTPRWIETHTQPTVMAAVAEQIALEKNKLALTLRDTGRVEEAREALLENAVFLKEQAAKYESTSLEKLKDLNITDAQNLEKADWKRQRKVMRVEQYREEQQSSG